MSNQLTEQEKRKVNTLWRSVREDWVFSDFLKKYIEIFPPTEHINSIEEAAGKDALLDLIDKARSYNDGWNFTIDELISEYTTSPAAGEYWRERFPRWINCSDRMPEQTYNKPTQICTRWTFEDGNVQLRANTINQLFDVMRVMIDKNKIEWLDEQQTNK
jgi:hypothetical protein